ncbi:MAG: type VI secretion protein IcmF/TssM N-terminal domain-containing protein, partial [Thalassolituus sp.]
LGIRVPVYLTFTKCDLVAGFSEFFDSMSQAEREQVWGISFPQEVDADTGADLSLFGAEFNQLVKRLNERLLWRVQNERNTDKRVMSQSFPAHLESLGNVLSEFLQNTFSPHNY